ncbi:hypothetical protein [Alistipes sp.]|uniref:hypothetical protein n=1 Tax=Alistipes sp. TaxID=1872444 RepID=UPI0025C6A7D0|nr:hypothetical protein [Alistipes sp.]
MKQILFFIAAILFSTGSAFAQKSDSTSLQPDKRVRKKFFNISYVSTEMSPKGDILMDDGMEEMITLVEADAKFKSDWGASIVRGRTYMFHRKPIARIINIGLDVSFLDLNYAQFSYNDAGSFNSFESDESATPNYPDYPDYPSESDESDESGDYKLHRIDYGWQIGPSVTLTPGRRFTIAAYFRYAPTFSSIYTDGSYMGNYSTQFRTGASFSYGVIGCGFEASFGDCKYKNFTGDLDLSSAKIKSSGYRVYLQFRW